MEIIKYSPLYLVIDCKLLSKLLFSIIIKMKVYKKSFLKLLRAVQKENTFI